MFAFDAPPPAYFLRPAFGLRGATPRQHAREVMTLVARTILALVLGLDGTGLGAAQDATRPPPAKRAVSVTVTGTLTDEGVECRALRAEDGALYTLTGDLKTFKTGD